MKKDYEENYQIAPCPVKLEHVQSFVVSITFDNGETLPLDFRIFHSRLARGPYTEVLYTEEGSKTAHLNECGDIVFDGTSFDILWSYVWERCEETLQRNAKRK